MDKDEIEEIEEISIDDILLIELFKGDIFQITEPKSIELTEIKVEVVSDITHTVDEKLFVVEILDVETPKKVTYVISQMKEGNIHGLRFGEFYDVVSDNIKVWKLKKEITIIDATKKKRYRKWDKEQREILNKCRTTWIRRFTAQMFDMDYSNLKKIAEDNKRKLSEGYRYKGLSEKEILNIRQKYQTLYKQAMRVLSYKQSKENERRQEIKDKLPIILGRICELESGWLYKDRTKAEERELRGLRIERDEMMKDKIEIVDRETYIHEDDKMLSENETRAITIKRKKGRKPETSGDLGDYDLNQYEED